MASNLIQETVKTVHHWNDDLFSFTTTRDPGFRFKNGYFTMIGLPLDEDEAASEEDSGKKKKKPLMRAYSLVSANYDEELEFFSIKVPDGPLTSKLQHLQPGDPIMVSMKSTGTLIVDNLLPGKHLYLLGTGTGLAPFMSIIKDPEVYEHYDKVILVHGVRTVSELAYQEFIDQELPNNEFFGEEVREKLLYYPTVTREPYRNTGRITDLFNSGKLFSDLNLPTPTLDSDRFMLCGSPAMLKDTCEMLDAKGFTESRHGDQGHYVIERAFVG